MELILLMIRQDKQSALRGRLLEYGFLIRVRLKIWLWLFPTHSLLEILIVGIDMIAQLVLYESGTVVHSRLMTQVFLQ